MSKLTRRGALRIGGVGLSAVGAGCLAGLRSSSPDESCATGSPGPAPTNDRWPMKGYGPANGGYTPFRTERNRAPPAEPVAPIEIGNGGFAFADDVLYFGELADESGRLHAVDSTTGRARWIAETVHPITASPALDPTTAYVVSGGDLSADGPGNGFLHALSRTDGTERWRADLGGMTTSPPVVDGTHVYAGRTALLDSRVVAFDVETGDSIWEFDAGEHFPGWPAVTTERVYVVARDHQLYSLDRNSGTIQWQFSGDDIDHTPVSAPTVLDGTVYQGTYRGVVAIDACSGEHEWHVRPSVQPPDETGVLTGVAVADDTVYASVMRDDDEPGLHVAAIGLERGTERWVRDISPDTFYLSKPVVTDDTVYVGLSRPNRGVQALARSDGTVRWKAPDGGRQPIIANGTLYTAGEGTVYSYSLGS